MIFSIRIDFSISITVVIITSILSEEFIASCTSIDDEKANNEWFFLLGSQNETESRNSLIRKPLISLIFRSLSSSYLTMFLVPNREIPLPSTIIDFMKGK